MDDRELTLDDILRLTSENLSRRSYIQNLAEFIGVPAEELAKDILSKDEKIKLSREDRIKRIMEKRYNVPPALINALIEEYESDWY